MADQKEFNGISREKLDKLRKALGKQKILVPKGDDVDIDGPFGVKLRAVYNGEAETLKLFITDKPIFITENQIWKVVEKGAASLSSK